MHSRTGQSEEPVYPLHMLPLMWLPIDHCVSVDCEMQLSCFWCFRVLLSESIDALDRLLETVPADVMKDVLGPPPDDGE